ncbi:phage tail sheath subtilisin-like domain-containing protein [Dyella lutea]|uniref:Phage tail sheath subtilisin-like domain-containing protein n=1 Tax=Dyella lutea TaxID=2950441 RepID=A0ABT1FF89_9GAMM|nr:phage tail sheath subtilisin-like domain-containing protein [Dyella lutea]MCP1376045.1 phage tail sheath subtilisin-like domain-containing protein [Dyella lutea]
MSTVPFNTIPANLRVPLFHAEVDNSQANSGQQNQRTLVIGQITSSGTAAAGVPVISQGVSDAIALGGPGSMLALMTAAYRASDNFGEVWYLPLADDGAATAAAGSVAFAGAPTEAGTLSVYIGASKLLPPVRVPVATTDTPDTIATALAAAINAATNLPVTAAVDGTTLSKVNVTAKNKGEAGNDIDLRLNYQGSAGNEATPAGITVTIVAMSAGATNPSLTTPLANLGDQPFDFIVCPYTDTTSLDALKALLNDQTGRWSWTSQQYGHVFAAYRGTLSAQTTFGLARNNQHESILGFNDSPTPNWIWAADYAGACAVALRADPGRPMQTLALSTTYAPPIASRFTLSERNTLLFDGISTFTVAQDGTVALENVITSYQKNAFGQPDDSYLQIETMFLLMYVLRDLMGVITSKFPRMKLAADGTRFAPGSAIVTPAIIRANLIAEFQQLEYQGYVQDSQAFAQGLIVQQNATNPNRVDVLWPGTLINQLRVFALLLQFRL